MADSNSAQLAEETANDTNAPATQADSEQESASSRRDSSEPPSKRTRSDLDTSADVCPICLDMWTTCGEHRLCCLKCGHLFGLGCLKQWLDSQAQKTCPTCKQKVGKNDIRYLYPTKLVALDTIELHSLKSRVDMLKRSNAQLQKEYVKISYEMSVLRDINVSMSQQLSVKGVSARHPKSELFSAPEDLKPFKDKSLIVNNDASCRVMDSNKSIDMIVVSTSCTNPLFAKFGLRKVDVGTYRLLDFVPLHNQLIRDVKFHRTNSWVLTASMDKSFKIVDCGSNNIIKSFNHNVPLWSCCWHNSDEHVFYVGEQQGSVSKFDMRHLSAPLEKLVVENDLSPVISIASIGGQEPDIKQGVLVCKLNSLWYFEHQEQREQERAQEQSSYVLNDLPVEGPFVSMSCNDVDKHVLLALRPNSACKNTRYVLGHLQRRFDLLTFESVHQVQGCSSTQRKLSRGCFVAGNTQYFAAAQESANCVQFWDTSSGQSVFSLPSREPVIDLNAYEASHGKYLFALTEKRLDFFKFP